MKATICAVFAAAATSTVSAASISTAAGSNPCTWGPSFWCSSKASAKLCGVSVSDCKKYCSDPKQYPDINKGDICSPPKPVGGNECTQGPSYWCASTANAKHCGVNVAKCKKYCANAGEYPDIQSGDICSPPKPVGGNPCTWGPSYWCASSANAKKCGIDVASCQTYCDNAEEYPGIQTGDICSMPASGTKADDRREALVGSNPCTYGPSYWCASTANAKQCGFPVKDCKKYCANTNEYPGIQNGDICSPPRPVVGSDPCMDGPSYWCASTANAAKCGFPVEDCQKYCANATEYPTIQTGDICTAPSEPVVGSDPCTYGPSYWCASASNAKQCGTKTSECKKYCKDAKEYPDIHKGSLCKTLLA